MWGATVEQRRLYDYFSRVSIHAPVWGATSFLACLSDWRVVSIHAPVWGATMAHYQCLIHSAVSIHAPVWGATLELGHIPHHYHRFNPRTRVGCDLFGDVSPHNASPFQSTHPCGVRPTVSMSFASDRVFQSTHPCGVRPSGLKRLNIAAKFQSTHPCGVRRPATPTISLS